VGRYRPGAWEKTFPEKGKVSEGVIQGAWQVQGPGGVAAGGQVQAGGLGENLPRKGEGFG
jgi:hypothetical protein